MQGFSGFLLGLLGVAVPSVALADKGVVQVDGIAVTREIVATGFDFPVFLTAPPNDSRLFVVEKSGRIQIVDHGVTRAAPFMDIADKISTEEERGLLGLAFHPDFASNGLFYIDYTDAVGNIQIASVQASADRNSADPASLRNLLTINHSDQSNHNGGWIGFGPDGFLYIGVGDGGGAGDRFRNAQNPQVLLGKLLRIDVDGGAPYVIPPDNPFAAGGGAPEIFAMGLRNPWRMSFDGTTLYIGDVGQDRWEELDVLPLSHIGANLGWNRTEGLNCYIDSACDASGLLAPILVYDHDIGCSITGGYVYRGTAMPALKGRYFFADFCTAEITSLRYEAGEIIDKKGFGYDLGFIGQITSFGTDSAGELYFLEADGKIDKLVPAHD